MFAGARAGISPERLILCRICIKKLKLPAIGHFALFDAQAGTAANCFIRWRIQTAKYFQRGEQPTIRRYSLPPLKGVIGHYVISPVKSR
jgi:hypothetical protein